MKFAKPLIATALLGLGVTAAQAIVLNPYYVDGGHTGKATVRSSGGCAIAPITFENARMGSIYASSDDSYVGWGVISSAGQIIAVENDYATPSYVWDDVKMKGGATYFEDMEASETYDYLENTADCSIDTLDTNANSKSVFKWDYPNGVDRATLKFGFTGYTSSVCVTEGSVETCKARKFSGSITFKGEAQVLF